MTFYSFHNEARDIYRNTRQELKRQVEMGRLKPVDLELHYQKLVKSRLEKLGLSAPKNWGNSSDLNMPKTNNPSMKAVSPGWNNISAGVKAGIIAGGAFSITRNIHHVYKGNKTTGAAGKDVAIDVATAGVSSAVIAVTTEGIKIVAKTALPNMAKSFVKGSAPVIIAAGLAEIAVDIYKGQLTAKSAAMSVTRTAGGWAGAEGGALIGSAICPGFGTVIGGIIGGIGGSYLGGAW